MTTTGHAAHDGAVTDWAATLRARGLRVTRPRLAVLEAVLAHQHASADDVVRLARHDLPELTLQSVYVILADLQQHELLRRIDLPSSPARYETRTGDNHHHAQCVGCGAVVDVDCSIGHAPCLTGDMPNGTTILSADILFRVMCADCREDGPAAHSSSEALEVRSTAVVNHR